MKHVQQTLKPYQYRLIIGGLLIGAIAAVLSMFPTAARINNKLQATSCIVHSTGQSVQLYCILLVAIAIAIGSIVVAIKSRSLLNKLEAIIGLLIVLLLAGDVWLSAFFCFTF